MSRLVIVSGEVKLQSEP